MSRLRAPMAGLMLAALASGAHAVANDGGLAGVFAGGAGSRALAMGGAASALANGAWGWTWNPASLAGLERSSVEFAQSAPDAIGARETQAALAVPDWRWGALALSWRQFGVDGIDGRDARGAVTQSFDDREAELGLAYAREFAGAAGLGAAVKLRRQSLAGRSGGGVGADLGATLRLGTLAGEDAGWWRDLTLGARLGNALRPAIRLDRDEVAEPASWSGGCAWRRGTGATVVTLAADLAQAPGGRPRAHVGAEMSLRGMLQLRAGWDGARPSAGTAMLWKGMDVSYTYRGNPLGDEQRVGLGWRFGSTVDQARELAASARERELQLRLQRAFDENIARRAQALLAEAGQALASGELDDAWEKASVLNAVAPGRAEAVALMGRVLVARAMRLERDGDWDGARVEYEKALAVAPGDTSGATGLARCRDQGDRRARRSAAQQRLYDAVLRGIAAGDPTGARAHVDSLRASGVADTTLAPLMLRLDRLTAAQVQTRLEQAGRLAQAGLFDEAARVLEEVRLLAPGSPALARARQQLALARPGADRPAGGPSAGAASRPAVSDAARREAEQLYRSGLAALQAGHGDVAIRSWELAILRNPRHAQVRDLLKREYLTRGLDEFSGGRLAGAVEDWQRALQLDPSDARTRSYLDRAQEHLSRSAELGVAR